MIDGYQMSRNWLTMFHNVFGVNDLQNFEITSYPYLSQYELMDMAHHYYEFVITTISFIFYFFIFFLFNFSVDEDKVGLRTLMAVTKNIPSLLLPDPYLHLARNSICTCTIHITNQFYFAIRNIMAEKNVRNNIIHWYLYILV